jgi:hypothetical protein
MLTHGAWYWYSLSMLCWHMEHGTDIVWACYVDTWSMCQHNMLRLYQYHAPCVNITCSDYISTMLHLLSWQSVLLMDETGVPGENHRPVASHWQTLSNNVVSSTPTDLHDITEILLKVALNTIILALSHNPIKFL